MSLAQLVIMPDMIDLISRLIERDHAYVVPNADGTLLAMYIFDVPSWDKLWRINIKVGHAKRCPRFYYCTIYRTQMQR